MTIITTTKDAKTLIDEVDSLINGIYQSGEKDLEHTLAKSTKVHDVLQKEGINTGNVELLRDKLNEIRETVKDAEKIQIKIAFAPTEAFVSNLVKWFYDNIKQSALIDIDYDPSIIGGSVIIYKGIYKDLSVDLSLNKYFGKLNNA